MRSQKITNKAPRPFSKNGGGRGWGAGGGQGGGFIPGAGGQAARAKVMGKKAAGGADAASQESGAAGETESGAAG